MGKDAAFGMKANLLKMPRGMVGSSRFSNRRPSASIRTKKAWVQAQRRRFSKGVSGRLSSMAGRATETAPTAPAAAPARDSEGEPARTSAPLARKHSFKLPRFGVRKMPSTSVMASSTSTSAVGSTSASADPDQAEVFSADEDSDLPPATR